MKKFFVVFAMIFVTSALFAETSDEQACEYARKAGSKEVWENYLETFPNGDCSFEAKGEISKTNGSTTASHNKSVFITPRIGLAVDFDGTQGLTKEADSFEKNQLGLSLGLDVDWVIYNNENTGGKMLMGFGIGLQYYFPTTDSDTSGYDGDYYRYSYGGKETKHYIRLPLMLNIAYEFKTKSDIITSIIPKFSAGLGNNFFAYDEEQENDYSKRPKYKCSFAWGLGIHSVFKEKFLLITTIGGDAGNGNPENTLTNTNSKGKPTKSLYGHHEFISIEFGYRF